MATRAAASAAKAAHARHLCYKAGVCSCYKAVCPAPTSAAGRVAQRRSMLAGDDLRRRRVIGAPLLASTCACAAGARV